MNNKDIYISLGSQCHVIDMFRELGIKRESLPFDTIFSTPEFVYTIFKLLFIDNLNIIDIVNNEFFLCDKRAIEISSQRFIIHDNGNLLVNSKYSVLFPHNNISDNEKFIRRLERFKNLILNKNNCIHFVYCAGRTNYTDKSCIYALNNIEPAKDIYIFINNINNILKNIINNYKIIVIDVDLASNIIPEDNQHLFYFNITNKDNLPSLFPYCVDILRKFV